MKKLCRSKHLLCHTHAKIFCLSMYGQVLKDGGGFCLEEKVNAT